MGDALEQLFAKLFQAHPWHGIEPGADAPAVVNAYIEIVPIDAVKYELDMGSGHLRVDRPQRFSSMCLRSMASSRGRSMGPRSPRCASRAPGGRGLRRRRPARHLRSHRATGRAR